jgi:hypothetical protein
MPVTLRNVSGLGDLEVAGLGLVDAGATFTVDDELGEVLARQVEHFEVIPAIARKASTKKQAPPAPDATTDPAPAGTSEETA